MQKILLHCHGHTEAEMMRVALETKLPYPVYLSFDEKSALSMVQNRTIHLLAYETDVFKKQDFEFTIDVKRAGFSAPILILAKEMKFEKFLNSEDQKLFYLGKPFNEKSFVGVMRKLMLARTISPQKYKRFTTQQMAILETFMSGETMLSQIRNLSVGGAYCEFSSKSNVSVGDLVKLKVQLEDIGSQHVINAKIIWLTRHGARSGGATGAGMKFVKYDDIYRQLMEKV